MEENLVIRDKDDGMQCAIIIIIIIGDSTFAAYWKGKEKALCFYCPFHQQVET